MTLKEIQRQIDAANAAPMNPDGTSEWFNLLPRVYYKYLPAKLKREADKITTDTVKHFLSECRQGGTLDGLTDEKISEALHAARYLIESTDTDYPAAVTLILSDFEAALESVTGASPAVKKTFSMIRQGTATNELTKIRATKDNTKVDPFTQEMTIQGRNGFELLMQSGPLMDVDIAAAYSPTTWQLFDMIVTAATESGMASRDVRISLDQYIDSRGLKDRKEARSQVVKDLSLLRISAITFTEPKSRADGKSRSFYKLNISSGFGISRDGIITFSFNDRYFDLLKEYPVMPYPPGLLALRSAKNDSYAFFRKITEHKNMNYWKKNADIISVKTLLSVATFIPTYKEVMAGNRHTDERIIQPFERNLDALRDTLSWEYCHRNGESLTDEELNSFDYQTFKECMIHVTWADYPEREKPTKKKGGVQGTRTRKNHT